MGRGFHPKAYFVSQAKGEKVLLMASVQDKLQQVRIVQRKDYAADLWSIRVQPEEKLPFQPGQYATLGFRDGSHMVERPYSIVSSPCEDQIEFFFELVPEGGLTPILHHLGVGEKLWMRRQAKGRFTFDDQSGHPNHFLAATVTGVAPFVSMVRNLAAEVQSGHEPSCKLVILHGASRSWEFAYQDELQALSNDSSWFRYIPTVSRPWEDAAWKGEIGRIEDVLRKHLDALGFVPSSTTTYLCGHPQMILNANTILGRRGFSKEFIRQEVYWVPEKGGSRHADL
jgi:ferredoxin--NADP+ reductase